MSETVNVREEWAYFEGKSMHRSKIGALDWSPWTEKERPFVMLQPTQQEQQAIDRALWSEIGLAIGRIEAKLNAEQSDPVLTILLEHLPAIVAKLDKLNSDNQKLTVEGQRIVKERGEMLARMDERLGAIERKQIVLADDIGKTYDFIDEVRNNADAHYTSLNVTLRSIYSRLDQLKALAARRATKSSRKRAKGKRK